MPRITTEELVGQQVVDLTNAAFNSYAGVFTVYDCTVVLLQVSGAFSAGAFTVEYSADGGATYSTAQQIRAAGEAYLGEQIGQASKGVTFLVDVRACTHIRLKCVITVVGACSMQMQSARWAVDPLVYGVMQGPAAEGAVASKGGNPVLLGGSDGSNVRVLRTTNTGNLMVQLVAGSAAIGSLAAGSANIGNVGISPPTSHNLNAAATTNATSVKTSAASLYSIFATNTGAAIRYLKLYNKASAPTVGTDAPVLTIPIPAGGFVNPPLGAMGIRFATGLAYAITTGAADTDTAAVSAANEVKVKLDYV